MKARFITASIANRRLPRGASDMMTAMDYADLYQKEWAEFQAHTRRNRGLKTPPPESTLDRWARNLVNFFRRTPGQPEDPYAYAMAP